MKNYLETFDRVACRLRPSLQKQQLEVLVGSWLNSAVLKVQKRRWAEDQSVPEPKQAGIYFAVWIEAKSLKIGRAFYNIEALRLRSMSAYSLQSREFAAAFRAQFTHQKSVWPDVSVDYGPQTLIRGSIALDEVRLEKDVTSLVRLFTPLAATIDALLDERKKA